MYGSQYIEAIPERIRVDYRVGNEKGELSATPFDRALIVLEEFGQAIYRGEHENRQACSHSEPNTPTDS